MILRNAKRIMAALTLTALVGVSALGVATKLEGGNLLSVQSKSMVPALQKGDLVSVKRVPSNSLRVGDVITFISPLNARETITHRIVETPSWSNGMHFRTQGDANDSADPVITAKDIVGKLQYSVPYAGYGADFIRKPLGLILIIYIPALIIMIGELRRLIKYYRSQLPYKDWVYQSQLMHHNTAQGGVMLKLLPLLFVLPVLWVVKANAEWSSVAVLTGNTIQTKATTQPPSNGGGSTTCTNNTNVNVNNTTNQNASSGNVNNSGNTMSGNASSGNASNSNANNTNVTINNGSCGPQTPAQP